MKVEKNIVKYNTPVRIGKKVTDGKDNVATCKVKGKVIKAMN